MIVTNTVVAQTRSVFLAGAPNFEIVTEEAEPLNNYQRVLLTKHSRPNAENKRIYHSTRSKIAVTVLTMNCRVATDVMGEK